MAVKLLLVTLNLCLRFVLWAIEEWLPLKKPSALGAASGLMSCLVAITPGVGLIRPLSIELSGLDSKAVG